MNRTKVQGKYEDYYITKYGSPQDLLTKQLLNIIITPDGKGREYKLKCLYEYVRRAHKTKLNE